MKIRYDDPDILGGHSCEVYIGDERLTDWIELDLVQGRAIVLDRNLKGEAQVSDHIIKHRVVEGRIRIVGPDPDRWGRED